MQLQQRLNRQQAQLATVLERVVADTDGPWEDALVFAASSILRELDRAESGDEVIREVRTERGVYTLRGRRVATPEGPRPVISVRTEPVPPRLTTAVPYERLRNQYRLTRKEARVAQLLIQRKTNAQIAQELFISPHTARHHTQSILEKLGVHSRNAIAHLLGVASI